MLHDDETGTTSDQLKKVSYRQLLLFLNVRNHINIVILTAWFSGVLCILQMQISVFMLVFNFRWDDLFIEKVPTQLVL